MKNIKNYLMLLFIPLLFSCEKDEMDVISKQVTITIPGYKLENKTSVQENIYKSMANHNKSVKQSEDTTYLEGIQSSFGYHDWEVDSILVDTIRTLNITGLDTTKTDNIVSKDTIRVIINSPIVVPLNSIYGVSIGFVIDSRVVHDYTMRIRMLRETDPNMEFYLSSLNSEGRTVYDANPLDTNINTPIVGKYITHYSNYFIDGQMVDNKIVTYFQLNAINTLLGVQTFQFTTITPNNVEQTFPLSVKVLSEKEYNEWYGFN